MNIHTYRIHYLLRSQIEKIKYRNADSFGDDISWPSFINEKLQSPNGKKHQLIDQLIYRSIIHFRASMWGKNEHTIARDILPDLSGENERRKPYATRSQDPRRR